MVFKQVGLGIKEDLEVELCSNRKWDHKYLGIRRKQNFNTNPIINPLVPPLTLTLDFLFPNYHFLLYFRYFYVLKKFKF